MPSLDALVAQPHSAEPPDQQGSSEQGGNALQGLMLQGPGGGAAAPAQGGQGLQPPSHQETVAILKHISEFDRHWRAMLADPEIGTKNMTGDLQDMMADLLGEEYVTMPQAMQMLKKFPDNPLEQKQFIEKHVADDQKAMTMVLQHYASGVQHPLGSVQEELAKAGPPGDRATLVKAAHARYKANPKRPAKMSGVPLRG